MNCAFQLLLCHDDTRSRFYLYNEQVKICKMRCIDWKHVDYIVRKDKDILEIV